MVEKQTKQCDWDEEQWDNPVVFSRKELESVLFVKEEFLHNKIQKKEDVFRDLTKKFTGRKVVSNSVKACKGYKVDPIME